MRPLLLAILLAHAAFGPAIAAGRDSPVPAAVRTGKERLSDKPSDEQRVDDCKVPQARRTRARPAACPWDAGSSGRPEEARETGAGAFPLGAETP